MFRFIKNDICRKELPLLRKSNKKGKRAFNSRRELVISLLEKKDGDANDNLCTFCIDETKIVPKLMEKERSPRVRIIHCNLTSQFEVRCVDDFLVFSFSYNQLKFFSKTKERCFLIFHVICFFIILFFLRFEKSRPLD